MSPGNPDRKETIRGALLRSAGARADANALASASVATWQRMAAQLVPVVGEGGVDALYSRCLHLQCIARHDADGAGSALSTAAPFHAVRLNLERREADDALQASVALLDAFTGLLSGLIGEGLTDRLLDPVWADRRTDEPARENDT